MRPVIDLLRETVELYPLLTQACGDECDPVNDPNACLASQIAWALEHGPGYSATVQDPAAAILARFQVCDVCNAVFLSRGWCHDQPTHEIR